MGQPSKKQCLVSHQDLSVCLTFPFGQMFHSKGIIQSLAFPLTLLKQD